MTSITCVKFTAGSFIDVLTNKPESFHHTGALETGLDDCHKQVVIFFTVYFKKLPYKTTEYLNYKNLNEEKFYMN